jgi:hypothetical protein
MKGMIVVLAAACAAGLVAVGVAFADTPERTFPIKPLSGSKITGSGNLRSLGDETGMGITLNGLPKNKKFTLVLHTGTCAKRSASFVLIGTGTANPYGYARYTTFVAPRGVPIAFGTLADGTHVIAVRVAKKVVACGSIPA